MTETVHETFDPAANYAAPGNANLTYRGGPLMQSVKAVLMFWGPAWEHAVNAPLRLQVDGFVREMLVSSLMTTLAQYSTNGMTIGTGTVVASTVLTAHCPAVVTDSDIQLFIQKAVARARVPAPDANTLYVVFTQPGTVVQAMGTQSCVGFCGYHDHMSAWGINYAVLPHPDCSGCRGGLSIEDALTGTTSHEICEAITDPVPGTGWYDDANGEIGDICAWQFRQDGGFNYQLEWSNAAGACV